MNRVHRQREIITRDAYNVKVLHVHTCKTFRVTMSTRLTSLLAHISVGPQNSSVHVIKNRTRWIIHYREYFVVEVSRHRRKIVRVNHYFEISIFRCFSLQISRDFFSRFDPNVLCKSHDTHYRVMKRFAENKRIPKRRHRHVDTRRSATCSRI